MEGRLPFTNVCFFPALLILAPKWLRPGEATDSELLRAMSHEAIITLFLETMFFETLLKTCVFESSEVTQENNVFRNNRGVW